MRYIFITVFLMAGFGSTAQGINFEHDTTLAQLMAKAKKLNKPIFIDCYTTWCGPCKWMVKNVFPTDTAGNYFNDHFVCAKFDMEKNGDGKMIADVFHINMYPTWLFLDANAKEMHRGVGGMYAKDFIHVGEKALDPNRSLSGLKQQYKDGKRDLAFIKTYLTECSKSGSMEYEAADWYFSILPANQLMDDENLELAKSLTRNTRQPGFSYLLTNADKLEAKMGMQQAYYLFARIFNTSMWDCWSTLPGTKTRVLDSACYKSKMELIDKTGYKHLQLYHVVTSATQLDKNAKWNEYISLIKKSRLLFNDMPDALNEHAWNFYEHAVEKDDLLCALAMSKRSIELYDSYYNNDTYAALCYKLKNKKDALKFQQKAIDLGEKIGADVTDAKARMDLIKKMK